MLVCGQWLGSSKAKPSGAGGEDPSHSHMGSMEMPAVQQVLGETWGWVENGGCRRCWG